MSRKARPLPSTEYLHSLFVYDPDEGTLVRRDGGQSAYAKHSQGYWQTEIDGDQYLSHRIIWKMVTGEERPEIDHKNSHRRNNRWINLRSDDGSGNRRNKNLTARNKSGFKGACFCRQTGRWKATIRDGSKQVWLGRFATVEEAHAAYLKAAAVIHGQFANNGHGPIT